MPKSYIPKLLRQCKPKIWEGTRNVKLQDGIFLILVTETGQDTDGIDYGDGFDDYRQDNCGVLNQPLL
jgi:hypothetical protein